MSKRFKYRFVVATFVLLFTGIASAELVAHWKFDEGAGMVATDSSGNGNDGTFEGDLQWVAGQLGGALEGNGSSDVIHVPHSDSLDISDAVTVSLWLYGGTPPDQPISKGEWSTSYGIRMEDMGGRERQLNWRGRGPAAPAPGNSLNSVTTLPEDEWIHVAVTFDVDAPGNNQKIFLNGIVDAENRSETPLASNTDDVRLFAEGYSNTNRFIFGGMLDDIRIYNTALPESEIPAIMKGRPEELAWAPNPDDGATDVPRDGSLDWKPGKFAAEHTLYFGASFEDVNSATEPTAEGLDANSFDPGRLEFDKAYFWRVDEVNGTPDKTVFKGDIWSFEAEPYSIQIPGSEITATASSASNNFSIPDKTLDGSGLREDDTHSIASEDMWFTAMGDMNPWIQYEFDGVMELDAMSVWNSNSSAEGFLGYGVQGVLIEYSKDGQIWEKLEDATEFSRAPGLPTYDQYDKIDFGGVAAKMVRLNIQSNFGGFLQAYSLSEVQFSMIPAAARTPEPASGATDIIPNDVASWRAGREAAQSTVYVSTDPNEVADGLAASVTSNTSTLDLSAFDLQMGETYYWRVDEVNNAEAESVWAGPVWTFSTVAALVVEDFESYNNDSPNRPFQMWVDGIGYSADEFFPTAYSGNGTDAAIGHDIWTGSSLHYGGDIMETASTVPGSSKSMPFYYNNSGGVASSTKRTFAVPQDWTIGGAKTLSIMFHGKSGNTGTLFAKINNTLVSYNGNGSDLEKSRWTAWHIDLSALSVSNANTLTIGVDGSGAAGMLLLDDILLYKSAPELAVAVEPTSDSLVAYWTLDDGAGTTAIDSAGSSNGAIEGGTWGTGHIGGALELSGSLTSYADCGTPAALDITEAITLSAWVYASEPAGSLRPIIGKGDHAYMLRHGSGETFDFFIYSNGGWHQISASAPDDLFMNSWNHVAGTFDGSRMNLYVNGVLGDTVDYTGAIAVAAHEVNIGRNSEVVDRVYQGSIDDVRIYNKALTEGEVLYLSNQ